MPSTNQTWEDFRTTFIDPASECELDLLLLNYYNQNVAFQDEEDVSKAIDLGKAVEVTHNDITTLLKALREDASHSDSGTKLSADTLLAPETCHVFRVLKADPHNRSDFQSAASELVFSQYTDPEEVSEAVSSVRQGITKVTDAMPILREALLKARARLALKSLSESELVEVWVTEQIDDDVAEGVSVEYLAMMAQPSPFPIAALKSVDPRYNTDADGALVKLTDATPTVVDEE